VQSYEELAGIVYSDACRSFSYNRLQLLQQRFALHQRLNGALEKDESAKVPKRDFYNTRKVDTHIHHSAAMNQKSLLRFIKDKLAEDCAAHSGSGSAPVKVLRTREGKELTLTEVLKNMHVTQHDLSINTLDMHADMSTMFRFDRFNLKYSPMNAADLREIFLKTENLLDGRYLAEITRQLHGEMVEEKYQYSENRMSIYGKSRSEWSKLAAWCVGKVGYTSHIRWMIQTPRLYAVYREKDPALTFQRLLDNYFQPLFEVTIDPASDPALHCFLGWVSGVDLVDDESRPEGPGISLASPPPAEWCSAAEPPYAYWCYYFSTNLAALNRLRAERGLTQLSFRPHCGEAGDPNHLLAGFLTAEHINHGLRLRLLPSLEYLFYLSQMGLAMSPLSNKCVLRAPPALRGAAACICPPPPAPSPPHTHARALTHTHTLPPLQHALC
jgi:AMP deaminase